MWAQIQIAAHQHTPRRAHPREAIIIAAYILDVVSSARCLTLLQSFRAQSANPRSPTTSTMTAVNRWLRPEVYPLFAAVGVAVGICGMQLIRNICTNPEVRVTKENRAAGILDNHDEGEKYSQHFLRKYVRNRSPEIMPSINSFFADPSHE